RLFPSLSSAPHGLGVGDRAQTLGRDVLNRRPSDRRPLAGMPTTGRRRRYEGRCAEAKAARWKAPPSSDESQFFRGGISRSDLIRIVKPKIVTVLLLKIAVLAA